MATMMALVRDRTGVETRRVPRPRAGAGEVIVRVAAAGVCRTDVYAAQGRLACAEPVVLGHEFAGTLDEAGPGVEGFRVGARVAVMPAIPCGRCARCAAGECCPRAAMLGVDRDGAFAEFCAVPAGAVQPIPEGLPFEAAAFAEPVAASLAVLKAGIGPGGTGAIYGENRIARLTERVLRARGFADVGVHDPTRDPAPAADAFDFVIETCPTAEAFDAILRAVRPGGRVVVKSRPCVRVPIDLAAAVRKEISFVAVQYGPFAEAVDLLASGRVDVADLAGPARPLADFEAVFADALAGESVKPMFRLAPAAVCRSRASGGFRPRLRAGLPAPSGL